jgi:ferredoxin like protein
MIVDDLFNITSYRVHLEAHIKVNRSHCPECLHKACAFACPARCYQWNDERNRLDFAYEPCLECGTCLLVCDKGALEWSYPRGGFGVRFRLT